MNAASVVRDKGLHRAQPSRFLARLGWRAMNLLGQLTMAKQKKVKHKTQNTKHKTQAMLAAQLINELAVPAGTSVTVL